MHILFNDIIQNSDAPDALKSPALSDLAGLPSVITLESTKQINCIGIGNTDATFFTVNGHTINFTENGLYLLPVVFPLEASSLEIETDASYIGRLGAGLAMRIGTSVRKEPSYNSTAEPRTTLSGQVIPGRGGHIFRAVSLDSR